MQNMVASCDVKFPIRLEGLAYAHASFANVRRPCGAPRALPSAVALTPLSALLSMSRSCFRASSTACARPRSCCSSSCPARWSSPAGRHEAAAATPQNAQERTFCVRALSDAAANPRAQNRSDVYEAFENIYPVLSEFRKTERVAVPTLPAPDAGGAGPA